MDKKKAKEEEVKPASEEAEIFNEEEKQKHLEQELHENRDKYLRSLAELENTRKRMQKERQDMTKFAVDNVIIDFLEPFDNFEKALGFKDQMSDEVRNWAMGFEMILSQLKDVLTQHGVEAFDATGSQFDPHLHEAVEVEETKDHKEGTILEVFVRGYKSGERTLRPAKVKVAKPPKDKESPEEKLKQNEESQNKNKESE